MIPAPHLVSDQPPITVSIGGGFSNRALVFAASLIIPTCVSLFTWPWIAPVSLPASFVHPGASIAFQQHFPRIWFLRGLDLASFIGLSPPPRLDSFAVFLEWRLLHLLRPVCFRAPWSLYCPGCGNLARQIKSNIAYNSKWEPFFFFNTGCSAVVANAWCCNNVWGWKRSYCCKGWIAHQILLQWLNLADICGDGWCPILRQWSYHFGQSVGLRHSYIPR